MKIQKIKIQKFLVGLVVIVLALVPIFMDIVMTGEAKGLSKACRNSPECMAAVEKEQQANQNAASAAATAGWFQNKVYELNSEIAAKELEIAETEAEVAELERQIEAMEAKLNAEQNALAELLVGMHFESDSEPITILAGSQSISDLAEKQARNEVVKQQISSTAKEVKEMKVQLEEDKVKVEELLAQQKVAKEELEQKRAEQQTLVIKYENDAAAYAAEAEVARAAQREAERAYQEAHRELFQGSSYTGDDTYPWQADCPHKQDYYLTYIEDAYGTHKIGGYVCECVSYAGWKAYEAYGLALAWGNAYSWDDGARAAGYVVDHNPEADSIGQVDGFPYGHVFWVEGVNADGSINVTEYNNSYATYLYSGVSQPGSFGSRRITAGELWRYNFIHLR